MAIERIEGDDARLRVYAGMTDAQLRECATSKAGDRTGAFEAYVNGLFVAESKNVIMRALDAGCKPLSLFMEEKWLEHEMPLVERVLALWPETPVLVVSHERFCDLTGY